MSIRLTLIDHNGKLAISFGRHVDYNEPIIRESIRLSTIPAGQYDYILGQTVEISYGNHGVIYRPGCNPMTLDTTGWTWVDVDTPIKRPRRNGKDYGWRWEGGQWQKDWFPRCQECRQYHDPLLVYCEACGRCHKVDTKALYCQQCDHCHRPRKCKEVAA